MTKIFLIRHAESIANTEGRFQGQSYDTDLSTLGQKQVTALKNRFADTTFDTVFTSPLKRTFQTAAVLDIPVSRTQILETNHGDWEGKTKSEILHLWPQLFDQWLKTPELVEFPAGEKFTSTANRVITWFTRQSSRPGTFAIVTHTNVIQIILTHLFGLGLNSMWEYASQPTAVTLIEPKNAVKVTYINDISHLNDLQSDLSTHAL